jgi:hypothetical protein
VYPAKTGSKCRLQQQGNCSLSQISEASAQLPSGELTGEKGRDENRKGDEVPA